MPPFFNVVKKMKIIVCANKKHCIGKNNNLLCYLPSDLKNFKKLTTNNVVIMGRKTFDSLPKGALPNRINIVITSDMSFFAPNIIICHSIEECVDYCEKKCSDKEIFVIGGGSIYQSFLEKNLVKEIFMTFANNEIEGDVYFPILDEDKWEVKEIKREFFDERDECDYVLLNYTKKK